MSNGSWDDRIFEIAYELEEAALPRIENWEVILCEKWQNPKKVPAEVKKSKDWVPFLCEEKLAGPAAWFRTKFVVPEKVAGVDVSGQLSIYIWTGTVQAHVEVFSNGVHRGRIELNDEVVLSDDVQPGDEIDIYLYGDVMVKQMCFDYVRFRVDAAQEYLESVQDCAFSLRCGAQILRADTYRRGLYMDQAVGENRFPETDERLEELRMKLQQAADLFDLTALSSHDKGKYSESQARALDAMAPVDEFAKEWTYFMIGHSHLDLAWKWRWDESIECGKETIRNQIENMKKYPGFAFVESSPALWEEIKKRDPKLFAEMCEMAKKGQFEPVGATWCENDTITISEESWVRHFLYSEEFIRENFDVPFTSGFDIDCFGFSSSIPQLFKGAGVNAYLTQKLRYNDTNLFPHVLFKWRSPDGSEILGIHVVPDHYQEIHAEEMAVTVKEFGAATGIKDIPVLFGVGNHGGGPLPGMFTRLERWKKLRIFPNVQYSSLGKYIEHLNANWDLSHLPTVDAELYLEAHRKTYTTQDQAKRGNRKLETFLTDTEKLMSIAGIEGLELPQDELETSWKKVLLQQFHDILPGTSLTSAYQDMREDYEYGLRECGHLQEKAMRHIASKINTAGLPKGVPLVLFNTLAWDRDEYVEQELDRELLNKLARKGEYWDDVLDAAEAGKLSVVDASGQVMPCQVVKEGLKTKLIFKAVGIPSMGYKVFVLTRKKRASRMPADCKTTKTILENGKLRVELDLKSGYVKRIFDKVNNREVLADKARANELQMLENKSANFRSWNIDYTGRDFFMPIAESVELIEKGPVRSVIRVKRSCASQVKEKFYTAYFWITPACDYPSSFFEQDIILYADSDQVDFRLNADWWEDDVLLKTSFPLNINAESCTSDQAFSYCDRPTRPQTSQDKAKFEACALKWADLSEDDYGVAILNKCKHGYDAKENVIRLTLLTSPRSENIHSVPDPVCDRGKHVIEYSLYPHAGNWREGGTVRRGWEYNARPIYFITDRHAGELGPEKSWLKVDAENIVVTSLKPALDGTGLILRAYETAGEETNARVEVEGNGDSVQSVNLLEQPDDNGGNTDLSGLKFAPYEVRTLRLS
ncbi:alpha-mannosidase [Candidatus Hydrogenedentota bacterium]